MKTARAGLARRVLLIGGGAVPFIPFAAPAQAPAPPPEVAAELVEVRHQGRGRLTYFGLHVYDARLWVGPGFDAARFAEIPLALELIYARTLHGRLIAERSLEEMRRLGAIADTQRERWLAALRLTLPDVARGDRITGVQRPAETTRFFVNGSLRGELRDPDFTRRFFAIWLAPQTSEPGLRQALLGPLGGGS